MTKGSSINTLKASLPRGLRDVRNTELSLIKGLTSKIIPIYESYGFEELSTPSFEYTSALGKFLPDADRPNAGVFSFQDDDEQWLSLRYDLTSPLARYVAENFDKITKPYKRYQLGNVWRNEKPGPGRYREFLQLDADIIGSNSYGVDAELIMLSADSLSALGLNDQNYNIRVSSRKLLDAILELVSESEDIDEVRRLTILRAIDKLDRVGIDGVQRLLSEGRKDESGDYTKGAGLEKSSISQILSFLESGIESKSLSRDTCLKNLSNQFGSNIIFNKAIEELSEISNIINAAGYDEKKIIIDPSVVRGLGYYTGPVYEADLTFNMETDQGLEKFGSIGGGGRYDDLVARLKGARVPSTGISVGVSRLGSALKYLNKSSINNESLSVVVLVMDKDKRSDYYKIASSLRNEGISSECYTGDGGMKAQLKYADKRNARLAIIIGEDEVASNSVTIKDLFVGMEVSDKISDNKEWRSGKDSQKNVPINELVETIKSILSK